MTKCNENELYKIIIDNSWTLDISNYLEFICDKAEILEPDRKKRFLLIDNVLKKILNNLKNTINIKRYDDFLFKIGNLSNQYGFDLTVKIIKTYYENEFIIDNVEYPVLHIIFTIIQQNRTSKAHTLFEMTSDILHCLILIHYIIYIREYYKK